MKRAWPLILILPMTNLAPGQSVTPETREKLRRATVYIESELSLAPSDWAQFSAAIHPARIDRPR